MATSATEAAPSAQKMSDGKKKWLGWGIGVFVIALMFYVFSSPAYTGTNNTGRNADGGTTPPPVAAAVQQSPYTTYTNWVDQEWFTATDEHLGSVIFDNIHPLTKGFRWQGQCTYKDGTSETFEFDDENAYLVNDDDGTLEQGPGIHVRPKGKMTAIKLRIKPGERARRCQFSYDVIVVHHY